MKKTYIKPELFYESFQLNQTIAVCGWDLRQGDPDVCVALQDTTLNNSGYDEGIALFLDANTICTLKESNKGDYCYTNGVVSNRLFQS